MFEERPIENYIHSSITPDSQMLSLVRQYDQRAAVVAISAQSLSTYESIADSDIIYLGGKEYWVSPKTLRMSGINPGGVELHTALFDHVEDFLAMDTFSGEILTDNSQYQYAFGVDQNYPIFFGEHESNLYESMEYGYSSEEEYLSLPSDSIRAYDSDILLNTTWSSEIENIEYSYQ